MEKNNLRHIFAQNVRLLRYIEHLSQEELADRCGLHRTYISDIEREERNISIDNVEKIANALNVPAAKLLEDKGEDNKGI